MKANSGLLVPVQYLRGGAAAIVAIGHLFEFLARRSGFVGNAVTDFLRAIGGAGVDVFFVISGFMMVWIVGNDSPGWRTGGRFWLLRLLRIVPLYWLATLAYALLLSIVLPMQWQWNAQGINSLLQSLLFVPVQGYPVLEVGWTLLYEFHFYLLFALLCIWLPRFWRHAVAIALLAGVALWGVLSPALIPGSVFIKGSPVLAFIKNPIVVEFAFGIALGEALLSGWRLRPLTAQLCLCLGAMAIAVGGCLAEGVWLLHWRPLVWGVPGALMVAGALHWRPTRSWPWLLRLGDMSYSIYLLHPLVFVLLLVVLTPTGIAAHTTVLLAVVMLVIASAASYSWLEQALGRWLRRRLGYFAGEH